MARKGQNGRSTMLARKVAADSKAPKIIMLFFEYFSSALPTRNRQTSDEAAKTPMSTPISVSLDPSLTKKMGRVGMRAWLAAIERNNARNPRINPRVSIFLVVLRGALPSLCMAP